MKVTVTDNFLNVRSGAASLDAPANVYLSPGDIIEVEDSLYKGDSFEGINTWYKGAGNSNYYWSGGGSKDNLGGTIFYNNFLKTFDQQILGTQGDQTTIIVIDEGMVANAQYFDTSKLQIVSLDPGPMGTGHGNFIGGILAGRSAVMGLVPKAKIVSVKYTGNTTPPSQFLTQLVTALQQAASNPGPTVINLSQSFNKFTMAGNPVQKANIATQLQQIVSQPNKFVICAAGDNAAINNNFYPPYLPECISVGTFDGQNISIIAPVALNVISPMVNFKSFDLNFHISSQPGSSFVTAVVSALTSCIISKRLPAITQKSDILSELKKYETNRAQFQFGDLSTFQYQIT